MVGSKASLDGGKSGRGSKASYGVDFRDLFERQTCRFCEPVFEDEPALNLAVQHPRQVAGLSRPIAFM